VAGSCIFCCALSDCGAISTHACANVLPADIRPSNSPRRG
jgi:hypothetical protein